MKKFDWNEPVPVYGAFHMFSHWSTKGIERVKTLLPLVIVLTVLKSLWEFLRGD